jgi:hypothetical protein
MYSRFHISRPILVRYFEILIGNIHIHVETRRRISYSRISLQSLLYHIIVSS